MAMGISSSSSQSPFRPFSHTHLPFSSSSSSRRFYVAKYGRALCRKEVYSIKSAPYNLFPHSKFGCPFQFRTLCYHPWKSPRGEGSFNSSTDSPKVVSAMLEWSKKISKDAGVVPHSVLIKESLSSWKAAATRLRDEKKIYQGNITPAYTSNQVFADTQMTKASPETIDKAVACSQLPDNLDDVSHNSCTQSYTIQREIDDVAEERINGFSSVRVPVMKEVSKLKKHAPERNRDAETIESIGDVAEERINGFTSERVAVMKEVSKLKKHGPERNRDAETIESIGDVAEERINGFTSERVAVMKEVSKLKKHGPERNRDAETIESIGDVAEERINGFTSERVAVMKEVSKLKKHGPERNRDTETIESNADLKSRTTHHLQEKLDRVYDKVLVVDSMSIAEEVVSLLTTKYKNLVHACDTEVSSIDVKQETPVDHGEIICFSIYSGPNADFGIGKSCVWVDVLDGGGKELLDKFAPFFEDPSIKKVWHNYSFDNHIISNYGMKLSGFHADTMHMARLWDSSRRTLGGYSLEALTGDQKVMSDAKLGEEEDLIGKISMKNIFGRRKLKKDGSEGKIVTIAPVESLQREERRSWISYSALDAITTKKLYESLRHKLSNIAWIRDGVPTGKSMFGFYQEYWRPFGELLVRMETEGMLVDRAYLAQLEKVAKAEQELAVSRFRNWASKYCPDAKYMNVGSDSQLRQFLFGGMINSKNQVEVVPSERIFKVPNTDNVVEEGKKSPSKYRNIKLQGLSGHGIWLPAEKFTATGWPSVSGDALKALAGKVSVDYDFTEDLLDDGGDESADETLGVQLLTTESDLDVSAYGKAYTAFGGGLRGREACHAIASLCEVCSIDSLISNFILPLQGCNVSGRNGRVHCSLNINTETGRLSARRPNLQNQPALEKDRYKIRQAFVAAPGKSLIVADYGQLELRILAHLANCKSMMDAFRAGGDFHSRTAMNMYPHIREAVDKRKVLLEWHPQPGEDKPPVPLLKDAFASERRKAKMLNFSIAYGKTPVGLARDWKVSVEEARKTVDLWYGDRKEVLDWQEGRKEEALDPEKRYVLTLLGRARRFPLVTRASRAQRGHIERAAINTPVQGSAADVAMCAMLEISRNKQLKELGWKLLLQVHDEVILEGPCESAEVAKAIVVECMSKPFNGKNVLKVDLSVDAKCAQNWYAAK